MKKLNKILSVGLSLVMCASMVAPAFAATFTDLQNAIDGAEDKGTQFTRDEQSYYGYGDKLSEDGEDTKYAIEAWDDEETGRNVQLNEDVERKDPSTERFTTVTIDGDESANIVLDLNGNNIKNDYKNENDRNATDKFPTQPAITVKGPGASLKVTDSSTEHNGAIIGNEKSWSSGIKVTNGANLVLENGTIEGNRVDGVTVENGSRFEMTGGTISNNSQSGVKIDSNSTFIMSNGEISENHKSGVFANNSTVSITGGSIIKNQNSDGGGGIRGTNSDITLTGTDENPIVISENKAIRDTNSHGGGIRVQGGTLTMGNVLMEKNEASGDGGALKTIGTTTDVTGSIMRNNSAANGGAINVSGDNFTMSGGRIENNTATIGGAILTFRGDVKLADVVIAGNTQARGGEIHNNYGKDITLENTNIQMHLDVPRPENKGYVSQVTNNGYTLTINSEHKIVIKDSEGNEVNAVLDATGKHIDAGELATDVKSLLITLPLSPVPAEPETPDLGGDSGETEIEVNDPAVPLASGPVTRAQFIDYLWRHEGEPEGADCTFADVAEDHEYVLALGWAEENGIAAADADGNFQPDELVTVAAVREFLGNFARVFGTNAVAVADLTTLTGADDEAVLNCDQVLAEFFGEEYILPEELDILEPDDAA